jgi:acetyl esterase
MAKAPHDIGVNRRFDIHPDMRDLLAAKDAVPKTTDSDSLRSGWVAYAASMQRPYPQGMHVADTALHCAHKASVGAIPVRIYRPQGAPQPSPCVVYLHGGAFIKGSPDSSDPIAWGVADHVGCVVVSVDYRLAPENPFPAGVEDSYAVVHHLAKHGRALDIDPDRLAVWGDSAGGNMAAAVCLMARDRAGPRILAQALNYACLTDELDAPAYSLYKDAPVTTASIDRAWTLYLGNRRPTRNHYAAPLKSADLSNMAPAHIHFAEIDCLADDSRQYAERLKVAGNRVVLRSADRMIHGFLRARFTGPDAAAEFAAPCTFLREILFGSAAHEQQAGQTA